LLQEEVRLATPQSGARGLEALLVRPEPLARYPVALIAHGAPRRDADRALMTPLALLPQAREFARRGWAAVVVMRRGFGDSGGAFSEGIGPCENPDYVASARTAAGDLREAIGELAKRADTDTSRTILIGHSAGGLAAVALTGDPPAGLRAAVSFAGGRGSPEDFAICAEERLVAAFASFGRASRVPMLWIYADNDRFFGPDAADRFHGAFTGAGGSAILVRFGAFRRDGHTLFTEGVPLWSATVDGFLRDNGLVWRSSLLPLPRAVLEAPRQLSSAGRGAFADYLAAGQHKAFSMAPTGAYGWSSGRRSVEAAKRDAVAFCRPHGEGCQVITVDDAPAVKP
jgi:dienelactone hydrolase